MKKFMESGQSESGPEEIVNRADEPNWIDAIGLEPQTELTEPSRQTGGKGLEDPLTLKMVSN